MVLRWDGWCDNGSSGGCKEDRMNHKDFGKIRITKEEGEIGFQS